MLSNDLNACIIAAIKENIEASEFLIYRNDKNPEKTCFGVSSAILLCSVIDSIGTFFYLNSAGDEVFQLFDNKIEREKQIKDRHVSDHFEIVRKKYMSEAFPDKDLYEEIIYKSLRCGMCHNNTANIGTILTAASVESASEEVITKDNDNYKVNIPMFHRTVKNAYDAFYSEHSEQFGKVEVFTEEPLTGVTTECIYK